MANELDNIITTCQGNLIVGEHNSIMILGAKSQSQLQECSRNISKMLLENSIDLDLSIADVVYKLECFSDVSANKFDSSRFAKKKERKALYKRYAEALKMLDNVSLYFKLQQAQLLKEMEMLKHFSKMLEVNQNELKRTIEIALTELNVKEERITANKNELSSLTPEQDLEEWYIRLQRRVEDLKITYTVSIQNQSQLKLLTQNNQILLDKIASAIVNTIPLWQTQMSLELGVELLENRITVQNKVLQIVKTHLGQQSGIKVKSKQIKSINNEKVLSLNQRLKLALLDLEKVENDDAKIRTTFRNFIMER